MYVMISVPLAGVSECAYVEKKINVAVFSDTINVINVKLCMMVVLIELYPFIPLTVTLIAFQGHSSIKQF